MKTKDMMTKSKVGPTLVGALLFGGVPAAIGGSCGINCSWGSAYINCPSDSVAVCFCTPAGTPVAECCDRPDCGC